ncbi:MAG: hypothetical protein HOL66_06705 [Rhodospirillaceae bacterium]|nr:hypothetical protein [Rhodospirillaceae bacterium]MBT5243916.1 hypothetical protein [Rhodospirillaceae bacterium]MBT5562965.1 hypothetical protein [Rhodospirillaceae bacterium]MBT6241364.1 hypothetical protein [Rhodospirillaceae bacterium]MBT7139061.1 hypothetical protein [Rhodospirillaceae bacterium]
MTSEDKTNPQWAVTATGKFHRLLITDPEKLGLNGASGIFVLWHGGLKPQWIFVDKSRDLGHDLDAYLDDEDVMNYESRGGVFASWAMVRPEYQDGVLKYLLESMAPLIDNPKPPGKDVTALPVMAPGEVAVAKD